MKIVDLSEFDPAKRGGERDVADVYGAIVDDMGVQIVARGDDFCR